MRICRDHSFLVECVLHAHAHAIHLQMVTSSSHPGSGSTLDPSSMIPQLTAQMGQLQLSTTSVGTQHVA